MKSSDKKLSLNKETVRILTRGELEAVRGAFYWSDTWGRCATSAPGNCTMPSDSSEISCFCG
jgi:hypothetical protein